MSNLTFDAWMKAVDDICWTRWGCSVHDLADCAFRDWYDDGASPKTAASRARRQQD